MNDRFRFRAFDKQDKELIYEAENTYDCQSYNGHIIWHDNFACLLDDEERYTVEQCTGLKDKNGQLIYEGDIVKEKTFNNDIAIIKFGNGSGFQCFYPEWKGKYSKETKYNPGFRKDLYFWLSKQEGLEVVGNIHENPELLEDK